MSGVLRHRRCAKSKPMIKLHQRKGLLSKVINKAGNKPPLYGAETMKGYRFYRSDVKDLNKAKTILLVKRNPEQAMIRLAKEGHKEVEFLD
jgi:hypothetical protein